MSKKGAAAAPGKFAPFDDSKLRPIHTAIDSGQHKPAIKLIHAALTKYGQLPVLKALLALCHAYLKEPSEARALLATLPAAAEIDPLTTHTLLLVYRALEDVPNLILAYEVALSRDPKNEELSLHYFHALARSHDYPRLQTAAMKLYTSFRKDRYLMWSALNQLLHRRDTPVDTITKPVPAGGVTAASPPAPGADKLLQVLEMMLARGFGAPKFPRSMTPEELMVLLRVYALQHKWNEAVKLLDSDAGTAFKEKDSTEYLRIRAQLLRDASRAEASTERLQESNAVYEELCRQNNDDWFFLTEYIDGEFQIGRQCATVADAASSTAAASSADATVAAVPALSFDARVSKLRAFLHELQAKCSKGGKQGGQALRRGPFLAEVELEFQRWKPAPPANASDASTASTSSPSAGASSDAAPPSDSSALELSLVSYFRHFGSKSCFFLDIVKYLDAMEQAARTRLAEECLGLVEQLAEGSAAGAAATDAVQVKRFQLTLSVQQIMRYNYSCNMDPALTSSSPSSAVPDLESVGQSMFEQYLATTQLPSSLTRIQSERGPGDDFLLLFAHHYLSLFLQRGQRRHLLDVILCLELGLAKHSIHNFQYKLWLIRLYLHPEVGAFARAAQLYRTLDIKQVQLDIASHLLMDDAARYGHVATDLHAMCGKVLSWHATADREDVHTNELAYNKACYSKIVEFADFRERRDVSLTRYTAAVLQAHAGLVKMGTPNAPTQGKEAATNDASNSKELTHVHAYVKRAREELLLKYPGLTSHSSNAPLQGLVANNDYTMLTVWDASTTPLATLLNRPAPALYASSFALPLDELLKPKNDDSHTHHLPTAHLHQLRFFRLSIDLLWAMLEQNAAQLRTDLPEWQRVLVDMGLLDASAVSSPTDAVTTFDAQHWRMCSLLMECSANVLESASQTSSYLEAGQGSGDVAGKVNELRTRWSDVQHQFGQVTSLLESLTKDLSTRFYLPTSASETVAGEGSDAASASSSSSATQFRASDPRALRDAASFAQFGAAWLTVGVQVWAAAVPSKKAFQKKHKKQAQQAAAAASAEGSATASEDPDAQLQECVLNVRQSIGSLIKAHRASLQSLQALCKRLAGRAKEITPTATSAASASSSSVIEHQSTIPALQMPENAALVQAVLQHIDSSHGHTGAQLLQQFTACDQPLQHIKL